MDFGGGVGYKYMFRDGFCTGSENPWRYGRLVVLVGEWGRSVRLKVFGLVDFIIIRELTRPESHLGVFLSYPSLSDKKVRLFTLSASPCVYVCVCVNQRLGWDTLLPC